MILKTLYSRIIAGIASLGIVGLSYIGVAEYTERISSDSIQQVAVSDARTNSLEKRLRLTKAQQEGLRKLLIVAGIISNVKKEKLEEVREPDLIASVYDFHNEQGLYETLNEGCKERCLYFLDDEGYIKRVIEKKDFVYRDDNGTCLGVLRNKSWVYYGENGKVLFGSKGLEGGIDVFTDDVFNRALCEQELTDADYLETSFYIPNGGDLFKANIGLKRYFK